MLKNILLFSIVFLIACTDSSTVKTGDDTTETVVEISHPTVAEVRDYIPENMVFAHRGSTFWTPEETEASLRWARNIGADYLEFDLQITKDGYLVVLHDNTLRRTSNVADIFPERVDSAAIYFTLKELRQLDIGSWFNAANPERARESFVGQKILTFKDAMKITEGYRLKKGADGLPEQEMKDGEWTGFYTYEKDPTDSGNRPGMYVETKKPNCEDALTKELTAAGWNINENTKDFETTAGKVGIANTKARFILQTFSKASAIKLEALLPHTPKCLLIWQPKMADDLKGSYEEVIEFCHKHNMHFVGSSITGEPNNYEELNAPWMVKMVHDANLKIHAYTFDTWEQMEKYDPSVDGIFTNRADIALKFYNRESKKTPIAVLEELGY